MIVRHIVAQEGRARIKGKDNFFQLLLPASRL